MQGLNYAIRVDIEPVVQSRYGVEHSTYQAHV